MWCERELKETQSFFCESVSLSDRLTGGRQISPLTDFCKPQCLLLCTIWCEGSQILPLNRSVRGKYIKIHIQEHLLVLHGPTTFMFCHLISRHRSWSGWPLDEIKKARGLNLWIPILISSRVGSYSLWCGGVVMNDTMVWWLGHYSKVRHCVRNERVKLYIQKHLLVLHEPTTFMFCRLISRQDLSVYLTYWQTDLWQDQTENSPKRIPFEPLSHITGHPVGFTRIHLTNFLLVSVRQY
jgi:hypothetical protein